MATTITFRLSDEEKRELEQLAEQTGMTISQLLRKGIKEILKQEAENADSNNIEISEY